MKMLGCDSEDPGGWFFREAHCCPHGIEGLWGAAVGGGL